MSKFPPLIYLPVLFIQSYMTVLIDHIVVVAPTLNGAAPPPPPAAETDRNIVEARPVVSVR